MEKIIRKLARSDKNQLLYIKAKDLNGIKLFKNEIDFTWIQTIFLMWLEIYHSLYQDLATGEDYLTKSVIIDDMRCDAYLLYRRKTRHLNIKNKIDKSGKSNDSVIFK